MHKHYVYLPEGQKCNTKCKSDHTTPLPKTLQCLPTTFRVKFYVLTKAYLSPLLVLTASPYALYFNHRGHLSGPNLPSCSCLRPFCCCSLDLGHFPPSSLNSSPSFSVLAQLSPPPDASLPPTPTATCPSHSAILLYQSTYSHQEVSHLSVSLFTATLPQRIKAP